MTIVGPATRPSTSNRLHRQGQRRESIWQYWLASFYHGLSLQPNTIWRVRQFAERIAWCQKQGATGYPQARTEGLPETVGKGRQAGPCGFLGKPLADIIFAARWSQRSLCLFAVTLLAAGSTQEPRR